MRTPDLLLMKIVFVSVATMALLVACDVHEFPDATPEPPPAPEKPAIEVVVSFANTDWPVHSIVDQEAESRASRADEHMMRYILNIYDDDDSDSRFPSRAVVATHTVVTDVPESLLDVRQSIAVDLKPGSYSALVWADYVDPVLRSDLYYDTSDFASISILGPDHPGNSDYREAFRGLTHFTVTAEGSVVDAEGRSEIELVPVAVSRPMARYEFITTDIDDFARSRSPIDLADFDVRLRYTSYMPSTYNAHTGRPVDSKLGVSYAGSINQLSDTEAQLGFDHVFVNGTETSVQVALDIYRASDNSLIASTSPVTVPLRRNHHTIVRGRFLTADANGGVGVNPDFDGDINIEIK